MLCNPLVLPVFGLLLLGNRFLVSLSKMAPKTGHGERTRDFGEARPPS